MYFKTYFFLLLFICKHQILIYISKLMRGMKHDVEQLIQNYSIIEVTNPNHRFQSQFIISKWINKEVLKWKLLLLQKTKLYEVNWIKIHPRFLNNVCILSVFTRLKLLSFFALPDCYKFLSNRTGFWTDVTDPKNL